MKRFLLLLSALVPVLGNAQFKDSYYRELAGNDVVNGFVQQISYLASDELRGRAAGSEGEAMAAEYIESEFVKCGLDLLMPAAGNSFGIVQAAGDTLQSRNVLAFLEGYDPLLKGEYIVIGARMDNGGVAVFDKDGVPQEKIFNGANGNASGLSMMLQLARRLSEDRVMCRRSIIFAAFGASLRDNAGSWYFVNRAFPEIDRIAAMVNLDMLGTGNDELYAYTCSNVDLDNLIKELNGTLQPIQPKLTTTEPVASDHRSFYAKEIPSVFFTTGMYPEYNSNHDVTSIIQFESMERELEYLYNFSIALCNGKKPAFKYVPREAERKIPGEKIYSYHECDVPPAFINSIDPSKFMKEWVYKYLRYPADALKEGIQGRVLIDFVIDEKGKLKDARVVKGVYPSLDEEALRVVSMSPDWKAGKYHGKKVKCEMSLYVEFRLKRK